MRAVTGVDFTLYRDTTIKRRIMRRMALHTHDSLGDYIPRLEKDPEEVKALYHDLLINVTSFFRDPALFDALKEQVYPEIIEWQAAVSDDTRVGAGLLHRPGSLFHCHELARVLR